MRPARTVTPRGYTAVQSQSTLRQILDTAAFFGALGIIFGIPMLAWAALGEAAFALTFCGIVGVLSIYVYSQWEHIKPPRP